MAAHGRHPRPRTPLLRHPPHWVRSHATHTHTLSLCVYAWRLGLYDAFVHERVPWMGSVPACASIRSPPCLFNRIPLSVCVCVGRHEDGTLLAWDTSAVVLKLLVRCRPRALYQALLSVQGASDAATPTPVMTVAELDPETGSVVVGYSDGLVLFLERHSRLVEMAKVRAPKGSGGGGGDDGGGEEGAGAVGSRRPTGKLIRVFAAAHPREYWNVAIAATLHKGPVNACVVAEPWRLCVTRTHAHTHRERQRDRGRETHTHTVTY
jgi:hypothetical protein